MRRRVAVLMGGRSTEHEISLASARSVLEALDPERYEVVTVEIGRDGALGARSGTQRLAQDMPVTTPRTVDEAPAIAKGLPDRPTTPARFRPRPGGRGALAEVDVVFPVLHGPFGEDGTVQGLLELAGVAVRRRRACRPRRSAWTRTCSRR